MRINAKGPVSAGPAADWLERLSKAALIDAVLDLARRERGDDTEPTREDVAALVRPVLRLRGDREPK